MTDTSAIFISSNQEHDESGETGHECKFKNILTLIMPVKIFINWRSEGLKLAVKLNVVKIVEDLCT